MRNWQIILVFLVALLGASSCHKMEMRGFVTSYENANVRFEQSLIWNNEQGYSTIELSKNAYEINVMGDSHVGGVENLDAFFEASQNDNVAAVAMIGDITTGHETDYNVLAEHLPNIDCTPLAAQQQSYSAEVRIRTQRQYYFKRRENILSTFLDINNIRCDWHRIYSRSDWLNIMHIIWQ